MSVFDRNSNIIEVTQNTQLVCASMGTSNCSCSCSSCGGCVDCVNCPNLTVDDVIMTISRKGVTPVVNLFAYPAYTIDGNTVCFYIDSSLTSLTGRYTGSITVKGNACGEIDMNVGNPCTVFNPYTVSTGGGIDSDLQPS